MTSFNPVAHPPRPRWLRFDDLEFRESARTGTTCRAVLHATGYALVGEAVGIVSSDADRNQLAARATVAAIGPRIVDGTRLTLGGVVIVAPFDEALVCVLLLAETGRDTLRLVGTCERREDSARAAALATLDATNRWLERYGVAPIMG